MREGAECVINEPVRNVYWHEVNIKKAENGIIIQVGCKIFVFEDENKAFELLKSYYNTPQEMEDKFREGKLFSK